MIERSILITGATGKVGRALVSHFLSMGDCVVAQGRSEERLSQIASMFSNLPGKLELCCFDLMQDQSSKKIKEDLDKRNISITHIINNARCISFLSLESKGKVSRINFQNELTLDVIVPYELSVEFAESPSSTLLSIVNIGSQYGLVVPNLRLYDYPDSQSPLHYGVAKAALGHLTKELAVRFADKGVRVNCLAYGGIEGRVDHQFAERYSNLCPSSRMLHEDELAGPVEFLLSAASSSVTGHVMVADGGWTIW